MNALSDGWKLVNPKSIKEMSALKVHINKECLSYIAPDDMLITEDESASVDSDIIFHQFSGPCS